MRAVFTFILSFFLFGCCRAVVSDTLRIDANVLNQLNSPVYHIGDTASLSVRVYNDGSNSVSDNIAFGYSINNGAQHLSDTAIGVAIQYGNLLQNIPAHGSVLITTIQFTFTQASFIAGSSIVVIWPVALHNSTVVVDSSSKQLAIRDTGAASVINPLAAENLRVFVFEQQLWIKCEDKNMVKEVRIYDVVGKLLTEQQIFQQTELPMDKYNHGVYLVEVILSNNKRGVFKVVN